MQNESQPIVFISYRRSDSPHLVHRIRDHFVQHFGNENVFLDFYDIPLFTDFAQVIEEKVKRSDVLVVIIGTKWVDLFNEKLINNQEDYVKYEIELAISKGKLIAPILIEGASPPAQEKLPLSLQPILRKQAQYLNSDKHFDHDIKQTVDAIRNIVQGNLFENELTTNELVPISDEKFPDNIQQKFVIPNFLSDSERKAIDHFSKAVESWFMGDIDNALFECSEAIRLFPTFAWAYNSRGVAYRAKGDFARAFADYNMAIHFDNQVAEFHHNKGIAFHALGDYHNAIAAYSKAIEIQPISETYSRRASAKAHLGNLDEAINDYTQAIRFDQNSWMAYCNRGSAFYEKKELEWAIDDSTKSIEIAEQIEPNHSELYLVYLGMCQGL